MGETETINDLKTDAIILYVGISILFIITIILIGYTVYLSVNTIDPKDCSNAQGEFGVQIDKNVTIKNNCGSNATTNCVYTQIPNLRAAINICDAYKENCENFVYMPDEKIVKFVDINSNGTFTPTVFSRQK